MVSSKRPRPIRRCSGSSPLFARTHVGLTVDRIQAEIRVPVGDVFDALTSYVRSTYINQFNKFGLSLQVYAQADSQFRLQPDDLLNMYVHSQDGNMVPLATLAHLSPLAAPPLISLYNLYPSATIIGTSARGFSSGQAMADMEVIPAKTLPNDVGYEWSAMSYQEKVTGNCSSGASPFRCFWSISSSRGNTKAGSCRLP